MKDCDAYQLVSFFVEEMKSGGAKEDITVTAVKIKKLANLLYKDDIDCDFGYYSFVKIANYEPNMLKVSDSELSIRHSFFEKGGDFVNDDTDDDLMGKLSTYWGKVNSDEK